MIVTLATVSWLLSVQGTDTVPDPHDASAPPDSTRSVVYFRPATFRDLRLTIHKVGSPNDNGVTYPIPASDGATIDKDNDVILARYQGKVYAFGLACPHQNTALRWLAPEGRFQCPKHKSKYTPDGIFLSGRATRSMDRYAVRKTANAIVANIDALYRQDKDAAQWQNALVEVGQ